MCGIAGILTAPGALSAEGYAVATRAMADALRHRGPDSDGYWADPAAGIGLGHRRLSINDLSIAGSQPMASASGRYLICFNGEIYGFRPLMKELAAMGAHFTGHSDTEVFLTAIETWGVEQALTRTNGMYAFALWDKRDRKLILARDRVGKKPLYVARAGNAVAFASELSAMMALDNFDRTLDRDALTLYLRYYAIPAPHSVFKHAWKLPPGRVLTLEPGPAPGNLGAIVAGAPAFWHPEQVAEEGQKQAAEENLSDAEALARAEAALGDAVEERLVADVPVGAFLSGGIDSTTVVALMRERATGTVETYTVGFTEDGYDEAQHAREAARILGTDHHELYLSGQDALDIVPQLPAMFAEPFADSSQAPTFLVSRFARSRVTVALSGDGGDEMFGGYNRHIYGPRLARLVEGWPGPLRRTVAAIATAMPPAAWDRLLAPLGQPTAGDRLYKLADAASATDADDLYRRFQSIWSEPEELLPGAHEPADMRPHPDLPTLAARMMYGDMTGYMPTDPLHKVDRASMAVSLEVRCPFLDRRVIETAWALPERVKIRDGKGKWLLREMLTKRLPRDLMERPKQGFSVPIGDWLRGPLKDWAEALLTPEKLGQDGLLDPAPIRAAWERHQSGRENLSARLWTILMLQAWREHWLQ